jgi:hypothetical protein
MVLSNSQDDPRNRAPLVCRQDTDAQGALVWKEFFLSMQIPVANRPSWWLYSATGISNVGGFVGMGSLDGGTDWHVYMLTPAVSDLSISGF